MAAVFFVGSCERPTSQLRGKTGLASLNRFRPTSVGSQQGICTPYPNAAGFSRLGRPVESMEEKKEEDMDVAEDLYVASDLYEEDDVETGIRLGAPGAHRINHQRGVRMARRHTGPAATSTRARPAPGPAGQFRITRGAGSSNALNRQCGTTGADTRASFVDSASRHPRHPKYKSHYKSRAHPIPNPNPHPLLSVFGPPRIRT